MAANPNQAMNCKLILFFYSCLFFLQGAAQKGERTARDRTLLELDAAALYVRNEAAISLDSALLVSSKHHNFSRISVIAEGLDPQFCDRYGGWIVSDHVDSFIRIFPGIVGSEKLKAEWLAGAWYAFQPGSSNYRKAIERLAQTRDEAKREGDLEMEAQSYCLLSKAYYMLGDTANGNHWYFAIINDPAFSRLTALQAKARKYLGIYGPFTPQMAKLRMASLMGAFRQYQLLGDTGNQVNTLMDMAYQRFAGGDAKGSQETALQVLNLQKAWGFPNLQFTTDLLAYLSGFFGDDAGTLKYSLAALDAVEITGDEYSKPHVYLRIAHAYEQIA